MTQDQQAKVQALLDRQDIIDCLYRYSRGLDRHDSALLASAFHEDAVDHHGSFLGAPKDFVPWANELHEAGWVAHTHYITNIRLELDGDIAHSESYVLVVLRRNDHGGIDLSGGRYIDLFERRAGAWRIAKRELVNEWRGETPSADYSRFVVYPNGTWDRTDPSYRRPFAFSQ